MGRTGRTGKSKMYLEQLGIKYPTVRGMSTAAGQDH